MVKRWTEEECAYLVEHAHSSTLVDLGKFLGRKPSSVQRKCYELKLDYIDGRTMPEFRKRISESRVNSSKIASQVESDIVKCAWCGVEFKCRRTRIAKNKMGRFYHSHECKLQYRLAHAPAQINGDGYVLVFVGRDYPGSNGGGYIFEHRLVMQKELSRTLLADENVHHKNGIRTDNSPENLELWITKQPKGQRPEDLLEWAYEIIERYK